MSPKSLISLISLMVLLCLVSFQQVSSGPVSDDDLLLSSEHLKGVQCGEDEYLAAGKLPECEPSCKNPTPTCSRMFYANLDYYPCFCKDPLVRDSEGGNKCVKLSECP